MPFATQCTNKECNKFQEPYMDKKTEKVYCSVCHTEITNLTHFAKIQLKSLGQFRKKSTDSFSVKCNKCGQESRPKVINDEVVCGECNASLNHISDIYKNMLKEKLKMADKDV